jgi:hypothetical protein
MLEVFHQEHFFHALTAARIPRVMDVFLALAQGDLAEGGKRVLMGYYRKF